MKAVLALYTALYISILHCLLLCKWVVFSYYGIVLYIRLRLCLHNTLFYKRQSLFLFPFTATTYGQLFAKLDKEGFYVTIFCFHIHSLCNNVFYATMYFCSNLFYLTIYLTTARYSYSLCIFYVTIIEEGYRQKRRQRSQLLFGGQNCLNFCRCTFFNQDDVKKRIYRIMATWRNGCFGKVDDYSVYTIPNHNPTKMFS